MMLHDTELLRRYGRQRSEEAFGEIVKRHVDLVYAVALRVVGGDAHLAGDITQLVFIDLARKASGLSGVISLPGWLHRHTFYTAAKAVRTERRRRAREQAALEMKALNDSTGALWESVGPHLDEILNGLSATDRNVLVLRFLKSQDIRAVGAALGISEEAAQKRVSRALEKLRGVLNRRGVALTSTALSAALVSEAATAAPVGLYAAITSASLTAAAQSGTALTLLKFMASIKLKTSVVSLVLCASILTPLFVQHQAQARLRSQEDALRQQSGKLAQLQKENENLSNLFAQAKTPDALPEGEFRELLRLRGEVTRLRADAQPAPMSRQEMLDAKAKVWSQRLSQLKQWLAANPTESIPELKLLREIDWLDALHPFTLEKEEEYRRALGTLRNNAGLRVESGLDRALRRYAKENGAQFPADVSQLKPYFTTPIDDEILQRWEIVPATSLVSELQPGGDWVITQKAPVSEELDMRIAIGLSNIVIKGGEVTNRWAVIR